LRLADTEGRQPIYTLLIRGTAMTTPSQAPNMPEKIRAMATPGVHEKFFAFVMDITGKATQLKILDVGAGYGAFSKRLHEAGFTVFACDLYPDKFQYRTIECRKADITRMIPYEDNYFDVIVAIEVVEHMIDHEDFFHECRRALKSGGKLMISTPNILSLKSRAMFLLSGFFYGFKPIDMSKAYGLSHVSSITLDQYKYIANKNDFDVYKVEVDKYQSTSKLLLWLWIFLYAFTKLRKIDFRAHNNLEVLLGRKLFMAFQARENGTALATK
jgi:2-polyprenyl-3-methyl-5-hydroxy-6-metoxy-1,4-benzoquinol methylase